MSSMTIDEKLMQEIVKQLVYLQLTCKEAKKPKRNGKKLSIKEKLEVDNCIAKIDEIFETLKGITINE